MSGLKTILNSVNQAWLNNREALLHSGSRILDAIKDSFEEDTPESTATISEDIFDEAFSQFKYDFDNIFGGFGSAPKFPTPHNLFFLLRYWYNTKEEYALIMVEKTLESMYKGGIYDHIGFGFSRYSTDEKWLVPHFEKMLYDNALLAIAYLEAYQATKKKKYAEIAQQIFTYVLRDMTSPEGGFYSAEDADSEGEEGKFYIWSKKEINDILGDKDGEKYCKYYNITDEGNFEGFNIPSLINSVIPDEDNELVESCRKKLFDYRIKRIHPHKDDKILTAWNGLMIATMAIGGRVLHNEVYTQAAEKAAEFILSKLVREDGRLLARYRDGDAAIPAYVDDYAYLIWGLIELYESTYKPKYLKKSLALNQDLIKLFWDNKSGGLFLYGSDSEQLIIRPKELYDGATPSGNSVAALNFIRLARMTGQHELEEKAQNMFSIFGKQVQRMARGYAFFLTAMLFSISKSKDVVLVADSDHADTENMLNVIREDFRPFTMTIFCSDKFESIKELVPFIENYKTIDGKPTAYICENFACRAPIIDLKEFRKTLQK